MDRFYAFARYTSIKVVDPEAGYEGYDLMKQDLRKPGGDTKRIARIVYWDAAPGFFVEMCDPDPIPLAIIEELITETKNNIQV